MTSVEIRTLPLYWMLEVLGVSRVTSGSGTLSLVIYKQKDTLRATTKEHIITSYLKVAIYFPTVSVSKNHLLAHSDEVHQSLNYSFTKNNSAFYYEAVLRSVFSCILHKTCKS